MYRNPEPSKRKVIVGFSGGVTSAWCAGWALRTFPKHEVVLLFHDTKEEHPDTYRFLDEMAYALGFPITERSHGLSVSELFVKERYLGNNQNTFCSRILKAEQGQRFIKELRNAGCEEIVKVVGYSANEPMRVTRMVGRSAAENVTVRFPLIEERITKQDCVEWCRSIGVEPSAMYCWSEHANCIGCVKGGRAYWMAVLRNHPDVYAQRSRMEQFYGHEIIRGHNPIFLKDLPAVLIRKQKARESIEIGSCQCGD